MGTVVDRKFTVERNLGAGGTAMVYLVRHNRLGTLHALKVLTLSSQAIRDRMHREGAMQANLKHLNVVSVSDVLDIDGAPGLLMEWVDGPSLEAALGRYRLTMGDAETLFMGILAGVRAAHRDGLVHRDLKPANILLSRTKEGFVPKVTDFGLAKLLANDPAVAHTRSGIAMGTPSYMAPEQIRDASSVDQRADLWSLGCILYELCSRRRAFPGDEALAIYNAVVGGEYVPPRTLVPELPPRLEEAIEGCLQVELGARIPDCETLQAVMGGVLPWPRVAKGADTPVTAPRSARTGGSLTSDVPAMNVARRGPNGVTPVGAPPRLSPMGFGGGGLEAAVMPAEVAPVEATEEIPETVLVQRSVDGTLAPPDSLVDEGSGVLGWLGGGLIAIAFVGLLLGGAALGGAALVGGVLMRSTEPAPVVAPPDPVMAPPTEQDPVVPTPAPPSPILGPPDGGAAPSPRPSPRPQPRPRPQPAAPVAPAPVEVAPEPEVPPATTGLATLLRSFPPAATVTIDGVPMGRTPLKIELLPGRHPVIMNSGGQEGAFIVNREAGGADTWCYSFAAQTAVIGPCP